MIDTAKATAGWQLNGTAWWLRLPRALIIFCRHGPNPAWACQLCGQYIHYDEPYVIHQYIAAEYGACQLSDRKAYHRWHFGDLGMPS